MSLDITFQKKFTFDDVINKTSITIVNKNKFWWMRKNNSIVLIKYYIPPNNNELITNNNNDNRIIWGITAYAWSKYHDVLDELVLTFQTKFITDLEEEMYIRDNTLDINKLFDAVTQNFGFVIEDGVIIKSNQ